MEKFSEEYWEQLEKRFQMVRNNYYAFERLHKDNGIIFHGCMTCFDDIEKMLREFPNVLAKAKFYKWHENEVDTLKTFCSLCFVDSILVERFFNMSLAEIVERLRPNIEYSLADLEETRRLLYGTKI